MLAFLLAQMPRLESLRYDYKQAAKIYLLDCTQLQSALRSVRGTLRELTISFEAFSSGRADARRLDEYLLNHRGTGSLGFLTHLTKLELPLAILLGWKDAAGVRLANVLPPDLVELCLRDDAIDCIEMMWWEERTIEEVRHWMALKVEGTSTPRLKRFGYRMCRLLWQQWRLEDLKTLLSICESGGVEAWYERAFSVEVDHPDTYVDYTSNCRERGYGRWDSDLVGDR
jgi:hypothetical protein